MTEEQQLNTELTEMIHTFMPLAKKLGLEVLEGSPEKAVTRALWDADHCTAGGILHGGYYMAIADTTGAACAGMSLPQGAMMTTIESKTNFFRGVASGVIIATAIPVHIGRTTIVVQTDITNDKGKLVSRTIQTQAIIKS